MVFDIPDPAVMEEVCVRAEQDAAANSIHEECPPQTASMVAVVAVFTRIAECCWLLVSRGS
ncbi:hypothetical protein CA54_54750 [Symmachiella macrocystis]|uniref:Uncharacterized protein n=1 Tax=Symmachiella macrocystis TaxID=2527985 RepID=A0A5C6B557_9PLAN|nr:hypothetical protein [Symmachiella macrocystis]TWU07070.1 hypothetical protein CA54_54750 [Symmachiella macrocystis]